MAAVVTASDVRAWGREQNAKGATFSGVEQGTKGRVNPDLVKAFNKGRKPERQYREGNTKPLTVTVEVPSANGRSRKVTLDQREVRAQAVAAGHTVGRRGRIPQAVLVAAATGTL